MVILSADDWDCIFVFVCCLDEVSFIGYYWWLGDAGSCTQVVFFAVLAILYSRGLVL